MNLFVLILFAFGLAVGSFLNVLIDRLPNGESPIFPPSHCDNCKRKLLWYDLIPVISFFMLGRRCRYCHFPIGIWYLVVEVSTGLLFVLTAFYLSNGSIQYAVLSSTYFITFGYYLFIISSLIVIFFTDLKYGIIPDVVVFAGIFVTFLYLIHNSLYSIPNHLLSALAAFLFFLSIYIFTKGKGMGFGDVKLAFLLGLFFGFPKIVLVLYIAFLTGAAFSIILIIVGKKRLRETIVFGPFLVLGSFVVLFFSNSLQTLWFLPK